MKVQKYPIIEINEEGVLVIRDGEFIGEEKDKKPLSEFLRDKINDRLMHAEDWL